MLISEITVEFQALKDKILVKIYPKLHCEFQKAFNYSIITMDFWEYTEYNLRLIWVELLMSMKIIWKNKFSVGIDPRPPISLSHIISWSGALTHSATGDLVMKCMENTGFILQGKFSLRILDDWKTLFYNLFEKN